ncbi:MAG: class I SAM-dependent methyltransferase [Candidatus Thorarchaeota archaeon]
MPKEKFSYDFIAKDYNLKRKKPWKDLKYFIIYLELRNYRFFGYTCDLGCANGRNFEIFSNFSDRIIGIDNSLELLKIAKNRINNVNSSVYKSIPQLILSDIRFIPIRSNVIHNIFSIATIHHIESRSDRKEILSQIRKILKLNGYCCLTLWRKFQKKYRSYFISDWFKRLFNRKYKSKQIEMRLSNFGDKLVSWRNSTNQKSYHRFYHFFSRKEVNELIKEFKIKEIKKLGGPNKKDNFFLLIQKID